MDASALSFRDHVAIAANAVSLMMGEVDADDDLLERGYTQEQIASVRAHRPTRPVEACGLIFTVPLSTFKYSQIDYVLHLFSQYDKGNLPFPGSLSEQPAQIIEIFSLINVIKVEIQNQQQRKQANNG